ncbi:MAG: nuclear transport factor 2 family protein [Candidatus Acidiferrales bacterium]
MTAEAAPQRDLSEQAVLEVFSRFYAAFEGLNLDTMDAVWLPEDWVECVHPGWDLLHGWEEVRESWKRIFANARRVHIALGSVHVHIEGGVAWVACTEKVTTTYADGFDEALVQATNVFVLREGAWRLVVHHGSPLPAATKTPVQ